MTGITDGDLKPRPIKTVAVLGGGLMGSGIATATLVAGMDVVLKEVNQKFLDVSIPCKVSVLSSPVHIPLGTRAHADLWHSMLCWLGQLLCTDRTVGDFHAAPVFVL